MIDLVALDGRCAPTADLLVARSHRCHRGHIALLKIGANVSGHSGFDRLMTPPLAARGLCSHGVSENVSSL